MVSRGPGSVRPVVARHLLIVAFAGLVWLPAPSAAADAALQWYQHYERGLASAEAGDWAAALPDFEAAARAEPRPRERVRTYGNRFLFAYDPAYQQARALAELGRLDAAAAQLAAAEEAAVTPAAELAALRRRIAARRAAAGRRPPAAGTLRVDSQPAGAEVRLDGRPLGTTPLAPVEVEAGEHRVRLSAPGRGEWSQPVEVTAGEVTHLQVALPAAPRTEGLSRRRPSGGAADVDRSAGGGEAGEAEPAGSGGPAEGRQGSSATNADRAARGGEADEASADGAQRGDGRDDATAAPIAPTLLLSPGGASPVLEAGRTGETGKPVDGSPSGPAGETPPGTGSPGGDGGPSAGEVGPPLLPPGALAGAAAALLAVAGLAAAWLARHRRRHPGERRAVWRLAAGGERRVGGYRVAGELGRGGMATTYRARRAADGRTVALKIPHETGDPTYLERFVREGRLGETLHHPGIVRIFEAGEDRGLAFLAMELLPGRTLEEEIVRHPDGMPLAAALEIARDVAEALDYAHGKGIVHRDLKPANVMLLPDGTRKVMDFGVARIEGQPGLTTSQVFFGSPAYAAPELVEPKTIGPRSDLYSLGVLLFEMLEGRPPFAHESVFRLLELHRSEPLPRSADLPRPLPAEVWQVITRLCAKRPDDRYPDAQALLVDLNRLLYAMQDGEPAAAAQGRTA